MKAVTRFMIAASLAWCSGDSLTGHGSSLIGSAKAQSADQTIAADAIYHNGRIYTVDRASAWVDAVAIRDGKFIYVGNDKGVRAFIGPATQVIDLQQKMAMPGLHDAHQHLMSASIRNVNCTVSSEANVAQIIASLQACPAEKHRGKWILGDVYRGDNFPGGKAHRRYLDEAFPDTPVYLREWSGNSHALANSAALRIAGIDRNSQDPDGGTIVRDERGEPTGELLRNAKFLVMKHIPAGPAANVSEAITRSVETANRYGITSVQDASTYASAMDAIKNLDEAGKLTLRVASHISWRNPSTDPYASPTDEIERTIEQRERYRSPHHSVDFIKIAIDGSPLQPHATDVNLDAHGHLDPAQLILPPEALKEALIRFDSIGMKVKIHAVGNGAVRTALDAIEAARIANGYSGIAHELAHNVRYTSEDMGRPAKLAAVAEMSPAIWHLKGPLTQNLQNSWPFRSLIAQGTLLTMGTDWVILPSPNMFPGIAGMVQHDANGGTESIALWEAIEIATLNGARSVGWDKELGSLEVGKWANMIVIDRNIFDVPITDVAATKVLLTLFEGKTVYSAAND